MVPATVPPALGRLSTTTCCPQCSAILGPSKRAMMSVELPAVNGTTIRIGLLGYPRASRCAPVASLIAITATAIAVTATSRTVNVGHIICRCQTLRSFGQDLREHVVHSTAQLVDDFGDVRLSGDEGRRQHHMVAPFAINDAAHRIADQAISHRAFLHPAADLEGRIESLFAAAVSHEFDRHEKSASPDIADIRVLAETIDQRGVQRVALPPHVCQQVLITDLLLSSKRSSTRRRMSCESVPVHHDIAAALDHTMYFLRDQHCTDRHIAGAQAFRDGDHVGYHAFLLARVACAGAAHAAHYFVEDQEHTIPIADLTNTAEVAGRGSYCAERCTDDG